MFSFPCKFIWSYPCTDLQEINKKYNNKRNSQMFPHDFLLAISSTRTNSQSILVIGAFHRNNI